MRFESRRASGLFGGAAAVVAALGYGLNAGVPAIDGTAAPAGPAYTSPAPPPPPPSPPAPGLDPHWYGGNGYAEGGGGGAPPGGAGGGAGGGGAGGGGG